MGIEPGSKVESESKVMPLEGLFINSWSRFYNVFESTALISASPSL